MTSRVTQCDDLVRALREAGAFGVHTCEMRAVLGIGNPSQRLSELEEEGFVLRSDWQPFGRNQTRGKRFWLIAEPSGEESPSAVEDPPPEGCPGQGLPVGGCDPVGGLVRPLASLPADGREVCAEYGALLPQPVRGAADLQRDACVGDGRERSAAGGVMRRCALFDDDWEEAA